MEASTGLSSPAPWVESVLSARFRRGGPQAFDRVIVDIFDEDPVLTMRVEAHLVQRDPGVRDAALTVTTPDGAHMERLEVFDGHAWREAVVAPRRVRDRGAMEATSARGIARWAEARTMTVTVPQVGEGARVKVRVSFVIPRDEKSSWLALPRLTALPSRTLSARRWTTGDADRDPNGPPRPAWVWEGHQVHTAPGTFATAARTERGIWDGAAAAVRVSPVGHDHAARFQSLVVLVDSSASQGISYQQTVDRVVGVIEALRDQRAQPFDLWVVAFDQRARTVYRGSSEELPGSLNSLLRDRGALGASNLSHALGFLRRYGPDRLDRLLVVSDGLVTAGPSDRSSILGALERLTAKGLRRTDVMMTDTRSRRPLLQAMAEASPDDGMLLSREEAPRRLAERIQRTVARVRLTSPHADYLYPSLIPTMQAGDTVVVTALGVTSDELQIRAEDLMEGGHRVSSIGLSMGRRASLDQLARRAQFARLVGSFRDEDEREAVVEATTWAGRAAARLGLWNELTRPVIQREGAHNTMLRVGDDRPLEAEEAAGLIWSGISSRAAAHDEPLAHAHVKPALPSLSATSPVASDGSTRGPGDGSDAIPAEETIEVVPARVHARSTYYGRGEVEHETTLGTVVSLLHWGDTDAASRVSELWHRMAPRGIFSVMAVALVSEATGDMARARRAYGSLLDLYPAHPPLRRFAARNLGRLGAAAAELARDSLSVADALDGPHPSTLRAMAFDALSRGEYGRAVEQLRMVRSLAGAQRDGGPEMERSARWMISELTLVLSAWRRAEPTARDAIETLAAELEVPLIDHDAVVIALTWDGDDIDMDLHVRDRRGDHAYYRRPLTSSGGALSMDSHGQFPYESFRPSRPDLGPYEVSVHVHDLGVLGFSSGVVDVLRYTAASGLSVARQPFVVTRARVRVDLGDLERPRDAPYPSRQVAAARAGLKH